MSSQSGTPAPGGYLQGPAPDSDTGQQKTNAGQLSPDGNWLWDGSRWVTCVSPDGMWRWDGAAWIPRSSTVAGRPGTGPPLLRKLSVGGAGVLYLGLVVWAAAFILYISSNGDYPATALLVVAGILGVLWLAGLAIGWRAWRRHPILVWLIPIVWFASYFPALSTGCIVAVGSDCDWGQGAVVSQGVTEGYAYTGFRVQASAQTSMVIDGEVWLPDLDGSSIWTYSGQSGRPSGAFDTPSEPFQVVADGSSLWVSSSSGWISKLDRSNRREVHRERVGGEPLFLSVNKTGVWVVDMSGDRVLMIDPDSGQLAATIATGREPGGIVALDDAIWVTEYAADEIIRIDPTSRRIVAHVQTGRGPGYAAVAFGSIWVANQQDATLVRIDPLTNAVLSTIPVAPGASGITQVGTQLWVANPSPTSKDTDPGTITIVDPATNAVTATLHLPASPFTLAAGTGAVWAATYRARELIRIDVSNAKQPAA